METDKYSTLIEDIKDDLPDRVISDLGMINNSRNYNEDSYNVVDHSENKDTNVEKNIYTDILLDTSIVGILTFIVTNKNFVRWVQNINQFVGKSNLVLNSILTLIVVFFFILYKIILLL